MSEKLSVDLGNVQKTLLLPLWGRAAESKKPNPRLIDRTAVDLVNTIDFDFQALTTRIHPLTQMAWISRSLLMDRVVNKFLKEHPKGTVVNIGCGLDTTYDRIPKGDFYWYDLDLPDVIELRRKFITESENRTFIVSSFLDEEWLRRLKVEDRVLFMAAGVFYYFEEPQITSFFKRIADVFPKSEMVFDAASPRGVKASNRMVIQSSGLNQKSFLKWGLADAKELLKWDRRLELVAELFYFKSMGKDVGAKTKLLGFISDRLKIQWIIHLKFNESSSATSGQLRGH